MHKFIYLCVSLQTTVQFSFDCIVLRLGIWSFGIMQFNVLSGCKREKRQ